MRGGNEILIEARAAAVFERLGGDQVDPEAILPADVPLELSGEAVRARLCLFVDHRGAERAMRPDLTLPVAQREAARRKAGETSEKIYRYAARAFRLPASEGDVLEFTQVGFERFGADVSPDMDASVFALVVDAARAAGAEISGVSMGDLAIFPAFVDALELEPATAGLLKRAFRQSGGAQRLLSQTPEAPDTELVGALVAAPEDDRGGVLAEALAARGIELIGTRSAAEIVEGLLAKAQAAEIGGVPTAARDVLEAVLSVGGVPDDAVSELDVLATKAGLSSAKNSLRILKARIDAMKTHAPDLMATARFETPFGRRFTYYDGFVFELFGAGADAAHPLAAGGRYDGLLAGLGGAAAGASAVGGVVRPDRIAASIGGAA
jgi:ATP phosphoribosyltransferase regulatory subunit